MRKRFLFLMLSTLMVLNNVYANQIVVDSGGNIQTAIDAAGHNDTIILVDGGEYLFNTVTMNGDTIKMHAQQGAVTRPLVKMKVIQFTGKNLGVEFKGIDFQADPANTGSDYFIDCQAAMDSALYFKVIDCTIKNFGRSVIRANRATYLLDTVIFNNTVVTSVDSTQDDAGYSTFFFDNDCEVRYFELSNSTFNNGTYRFLDNITATEKNILINNCTFNKVNAAFRNEDFIRLDNATGGTLTIKNSIITNILGATKALFTIPATITDSISNTIFFNSEQDTANVWSYMNDFTSADPQYADEAIVDFTLGNASLLTASTTGGIIGDPRWAPKSDDATLSDLKVNDMSVDGFSASTYFYTVTLVAGTVDVPSITAVSTDVNAKIDIVPAATLADTTMVNVTAENGTDMLTYKVKFMVALPGGMIAYWKMDDGSGTTVTDESGISNGTLINAGAGAWIDGYAGKAIDITAKASTDTSLFIEVPGDSVDFTSAESFSFSVIVKLDITDGSEQSIISKGMPYVSNGGWYHLSYKQGSGRFMIWDSTSLSSTTGVFPNSFPQNDWVHIVCVRNRTTDSLEMYLNGILWDKVLDNVEGEISNDGNLFIGTVPSSKTDCRGAIDEVQIYEKALSAAEIKALAVGYGFAPIIDSDDATLSEISVSNSPVNGFSPSTLNYDVELPNGTTTVPDVTATTTDENAGKLITKAAGLPGSTTILVTAEDGLTTKTYTINFTVAKSSNANLSNITLDPDFDLTPAFSASTTSYTVEVPEGTSSISITAETEDDDASVAGDGSINLTTANTNVDLVVTAEDGTEKTYSVSISLVTGINNILINEVTMYPNPVINKLYISSAIAIDAAKIFDINGQLIGNFTITDTHKSEIDVDHLSSGKYIVQFYHNNVLLGSKSFIK